MDDLDAVGREPAVEEAAVHLGEADLREERRIRVARLRPQELDGAASLVPPSPATGTSGIEASRPVQRANIVAAASTDTWSPSEVSLPGVADRRLNASSNEAERAGEEYSTEPLIDKRWVSPSKRAVTTTSSPFLCTMNALDDSASNSI